MAAVSRRWKDEFGFAKTICSKLGCTVEPSAHAYEIAKVKGEGISLVIYSHTTTSTRNKSARVRDNGSKDKEAARRVLLVLKNGEGLPDDVRERVSMLNTFHCKTLP
ncbi:hypothetical protein XM25_08010 [Devosia sp. H5989]|nr:hypothetical protein XM25_08010 [Devosia sp. H5989]